MVISKDVNIGTENCNITMVLTQLESQGVTLFIKCPTNLSSYMDTLENHIVHILFYLPSSQGVLHSIYLYQLNPQNYTVAQFQHKFTLRNRVNFKLCTTVKK